jgi:hypothetical protein
MNIDDAGESRESGGSAVVRLRALAHPLRWKLIDVIDAEGTATATRCAQLTGESVASCSYHLGMLAKYGYVEAAPAEGRERPWRMASREQDLSAPPGDVDAALASEEAVGVFLEHEFERMRARHRTLGLEPEEWREATVAGGSTVWVTAAELHAIKDELTELLHRYDDRSDPAARPAGSRLARVFVAASVGPPVATPR